MAITDIARDIDVEPSCMEMLGARSLPSLKSTNNNGFATGAFCWHTAAFHGIRTDLNVEAYLDRV